MTLNIKITCDFFPYIGFIMILQKSVVFKNLSGYIHKKCALFHYLFADDTPLYHILWLVCLCSYVLILNIVGTKIDFLSLGAKAFFFIFSHLLLKLLVSKGKQWNICFRFLQKLFSSCKRSAQFWFAKPFLLSFCDLYQNFFL